LEKARKNNQNTKTMNHDKPKNPKGRNIKTKFNKIPIKSTKHGKSKSKEII